MVKKAKPDTIRKIRKAMKAVEKKGVSIADAKWGTEFDSDLGYFVPSKNSDGTSTSGVCALGALLIYTNGKIKFKPHHGQKKIDEEDESAMAAYILGVDEAWVSAFVHGFDGNEAPDELDDDRDVDCVDEKGRLVIVDDEGEEKAVSPRSLSAADRERIHAFIMGRQLREEFIE